MKVFIDGSSGTTGLRIHDRLQSRSDIELIRLEESVRKDPAARREALNSADVAFLCLPDAASIEAVSMVESDTVVIDTSTAHRTNEDWTYGFPELKGMKEKIARSKRIANPGCHASGFIALVAPLVEAGVIKKGDVLSCTSLTGYSGGGKKMIEQYETSNDALLRAPRLYGISQKHKHIPEMMKVCGLEAQPAFCPIVSNYYSGMEVIVPLETEEDVKGIYKDYYTSELVKYKEDADEEGFLSACLMSGRDDMEISVYGNGKNTLLVSRFDNLGKGASGAAIQNMNIVMGIEETHGLKIQ